MTAITAGELPASDLGASATAFDHTLLRAAAALDAYVLLRVQRRRGSQPRRALIAQTAAGDARRHAEALAAIGMLPR
jgi:predicted secreted Zn-dependent protease